MVYAMFLLDLLEICNYDVEENAQKVKEKYSPMITNNPKIHKDSVKFSIVRALWY